MYIGRFAPSPAGLLHIGSLLTAVASYVDACAHQGKWPVRVEDLDPPRETPGTAADILCTLEAFGFEWNGKVAYQSYRYSLYQDTFDRLQAAGLVYLCYRSRKDWQAAATQGADGFVYNGRCRSPQQRPNTQNKMPAWRIQVPNRVIGLSDGIVGQYVQNLAHDIGDFVLLRADGHWAYQLAVAVDDADQGITHIVRGQDLLISTSRQIYLQQCLGAPTPSYTHLPLLTNNQGQKWSKQTLTPILGLNQKEQLLRQVLTYLNLPDTPAVNRPQGLLDWTVVYWQMDKVSKSSIITK